MSRRRSLRNAVQRIRHRGTESGVATLTMVMVLFFVMAMVAAYTNRNLLYEQRMSINNFRATAGMAAADAGIDWTIAMLSGARVDTNCAAPNAPTAADVDFRNRYTTFQADGSYTVPKQAISGALLSPSCVFTAAGWSCKCPNLANPVLALDYPANTAPIFSVEIDSNGSPGILTVDVRGSHEASLNNSFGTLGNYNRVQVSLALARALPVAPVAALTAGRNVDMSAAASLKVSNPDPKSAVTIHAGNDFRRSGVVADPTADPDASLLGPAGSSGDTIRSDANLAGMAGTSQFFQSLFGMDAATFKRQPAAVFLDCAAGCNSANIATALANNPGRIIWIDGDINLDNAATLGTAAQPVMLVASGDITISSQLIINGFISSGRDILWNAAAGSLVLGAVVASRDFVGTTPVTIAYDADMMQHISLGYGSFVRVPGSWHVISGR